MTNTIAPTYHVTAENPYGLDYDYAEITELSAAALIRRFVKRGCTRITLNGVELTDEQLEAFGQVIV